MKNKLKLFGLSALLMTNTAFGGNNKKNPKVKEKNKSAIELTYQAQPIEVQNLNKGIILNIGLSNQGIKVFEFENSSDEEIYVETPKGKIIDVSMNPKGNDKNCVISKDGKNIFFSSERINAKGKKQTDIFKANIENLINDDYQIKLENISKSKKKSNNPSISKDGTKLVYEENSQIIFANLITGIKEQLTKQGENYQPNIINNKIVYASIGFDKQKRNGILVIDLKDSLRNPQAIVKNSEYYFSSPVFSSDENKITYVKDFSKVYVKDLKSNKNKAISSTYGTVSAPSWSYDNTFVSYLGTKEDSKGKDKIELYVVNVKNLDEIKKEKIYSDNNPSRIVLNEGFKSYEGALSTISSDGNTIYSGGEFPIKEYTNTLISSDTASK